MSTRTQKEINDEIKALEAQIDDIQNINKHRPEVVELQNKIYDIKNKYRAEIETSVNCWKSDIQALKKEIKNKKEENKIQLSERIEKWLDKYLSGVSFGYKEPKIVWISEDERFVIITAPGSTAGTGTAMGTGGYYYAASTHWLADTTNNTRYVDSSKYRTVNMWKEFEGRLTKDKKQELIEFTNTLRNENAG